jgi:hypothetical protein
MRTSPFLIAVLGLAALPAVAQQQCSPLTTRGFWVHTCDGYLTPPPPAPAELLPSRILGTCTASKTALWDCTGTVNLGGQILDQAVPQHPLRHTGQWQHNQGLAHRFRPGSFLRAQPPQNQWPLSRCGAPCCPGVTAISAEPPQGSFAPV